MNKKIFILFASVVCGGALFTSCNDLDADKYFVDRTTIENVFEEATRSEQWLAEAYSYLRGGNAEVSSKGDTGGGGGDWNPFNFDDDMYYGDRDRSPEFGGDLKDAVWASYNGFHEGLYDESVSQNSWTYCYRGIRQASIFIQNIYMNKELSQEEIEDYRGQARFLRAYYYWLLLRKYGPVPIMPDEGEDYTLSYAKLARERSTYEEVANYIGDEMIKAAKELKALGGVKDPRDQDKVARPTVGAALATRAIVYIYAASPLANGQLQNGQHPAGVTDAVAKALKNFDGTPLLSLEYDESKWARAAAACRDVIELNTYELYHEPAVTTPTEVYAKTVPCYEDGDFSEKTWLEGGYSDIDPMLSYRNLFNGTVRAYENPEFIFGRINNVSYADPNLGIGALVSHSMPTTLRGWNTHGLTQKMVDAYYMKDGSDAPGARSEWGEGDGSERLVGWTTRNDIIRDNKYPELLIGARTGGQNVSLQYVQREPRFYASVAFSGSTWELYGDPSAGNRFKQIFYYRNDGNGYVNNFKYLRTGIGCKKFYHPYDYLATGGHDYSHVMVKDEMAIRYADILLMYAEALNELTRSYEIASWDGSTTYSISRDVNEMKRGIRDVRRRAGLPDYTAEEYGNPNLLRAKIKRERMIEFLGEAKRYFDLRRWMDAPVEESKTIYGLDVFQTKDAKSTDYTNRNKFMQVVPITNLSATFSDKMYFWPIKHSELKRNSKLVQNPGWTYND